MKLYEELKDAIAEVTSVAEETSEYKVRFSKLIENYYDNSFAERDINDVIELIEFTGDCTNGN